MCQFMWYLYGKKYRVQWTIVNAGQRGWKHWKKKTGNICDQIILDVLQATNQFCKVH